MDETSLSRLRRIRNTRMAALIGSAAAASVLGLAGWLIISPQGSAVPTQPPGEGMVDWVGPATSLAEMEQESEIIVVGQVVGIVGTDRVYPIGYDASDGHLPEGVDRGITFTNLEVKVTRYLKGDGSPTITLRQTGDLARTNGPLEFPKPKFGEPMILFLTAERERGANVWASSRGPWGRLSEQHGTMFYAWGDGPREVPWAARMTFDETTAHIQAAVESARAE